MATCAFAPAESQCVRAVNGQVLQAICACGKVFEHDSRFCNKCGAFRLRLETGNQMARETPLKRKRATETPGTIEKQVKPRLAGAESRDSIMPNDFWPSSLQLEKVTSERERVETQTDLFAKQLCYIPTPARRPPHNQRNRVERIGGHTKLQDFPQFPPSKVLSSECRERAEVQTEKKKIIFLDCDGVICCNPELKLEEPQLKQLRRVVEETHAKVVLSTHWRWQPVLKHRVTTALEGLGIEVIGATPVYQIERPLRPREITAWLAEHPDDADTWVAIDDRALLDEVGGAELQGKFVQTEESTGLTAALANHCIEILGRA